MKKQLILLAIAMLPFLANAQTATDFLNFGQINDQLTKPACIALRGKPDAEKNDSKVNSITYYFKQGGTDNDGSFLFSFDKDGALLSYIITTDNLFTADLPFVETWLKSKFKITDDFAKLFYYNEQQLTDRFIIMGLLLMKGSHDKTSTQYTGLLQSEGLLVSIKVGSEKSPAKGHLQQILVGYNRY
jgi:hypothetical protein